MANWKDRQRAAEVERMNSQFSKNKTAPVPIYGTEFHGMWLDESGGIMTKAEAEAYDRAREAERVAKAERAARFAKAMEDARTKYLQQATWADGTQRLPLPGEMETQTQVVMEYDYEKMQWRTVGRPVKLGGGTVPDNWGRLPRSAYEDVPEPPAKEVKPGGEVRRLAIRMLAQEGEIANQIREAQAKRENANHLATKLEAIRWARKELDKAIKADSEEDEDEKC